MTDHFFEKKSIGLLILAGGRSKRMGRDKSSLEIGGKTFAVHIANAMGNFDEKLISYNKPYCDPGEIPEGFVKVPDEEDIRGKGPAAGIATALRECRSRWLMVVPCDVPMIDRQTAMNLWNALDNRDVIVTARGSRGTEPLIGIYPKKCWPLIRQMVLSGIYVMREILEHIGYETVSIDDEKLININTPTEYEEKIAKK